jgi:hypothetical protein
MGPQQVLALDVSAWNGGTPLSEEVSAGLKSALARLKSLLG